MVICIFIFHPFQFLHNFCIYMISLRTLLFPRNTDICYFSIKLTVTLRDKNIEAYELILSLSVSNMKSSVLFFPSFSFFHFNLTKIYTFTLIHMHKEIVVWTTKIGFETILFFFFFAYEMNDLLAVWWDGCMRLVMVKTSFWSNKKLLSMKMFYEHKLCVAVNEYLAKLVLMSHPYGRV